MCCLCGLFTFHVFGGTLCAHVCRNLHGGHVSLWQCMLDWSDGPPVQRRGERDSLSRTDGKG